MYLILIPLERVCYFINKDNMGDQTQNTIASNLNNESSSEEDDSVKNK